MSFGETIEALNPSVVRIVTVQRRNDNQWVVTGQLGTGFVLTDDGYIATAGHNLQKITQQTQLAILLQPTQLIPCKLVASNIQWNKEETAQINADLGVLKTEGAHAPLPFVPIGDPMMVLQGDEVGVLGYQSLEDPRALGVMNLPPQEMQEFVRSVQGNTFAAKSIVGTRFDLEMGERQSTFFFLDRHLSAGLSGAPVFWAESGEVVGVVSASKVEAQMSGIAQYIVPAGVTKCIGVQLLQHCVAGLRAKEQEQPPEGE